MLSLAGAPDPTFGTDGIAPVSYTSQAFVGSVVGGVAVQPDGKTVTVGYTAPVISNPFGNGAPDAFAVSRLNPDGSPDTSFGNGGVVFPFGTTNSNGSVGDQVIVLPDGKIVAVGDVGGQIGVVQLNSNGSIDTSFGTDGSTLISLGSTSSDTISVSAIALGPDGTIILGSGMIPTGTNEEEASVIRLDANGTLDTTFGTGGISSFPFNPVNGGSIVLATGEVSSLAVQADGKVVVTASSSGTVEVDRLDTNGTLDSTFGTAGQVTLPLDVTGDSLYRGTASAVAIQADGKILLSGVTYVYTGPASDPTSVATPDKFVARLNTDGSPDTSFGGTGAVLAGSLGAVPVNPGPAAGVSAVAVEPDGKILVSGVNDSAVSSLIRINSDGSPDLTFGTGGEYTHPSTLSSPVTTSLAILPSGKIEIAGDVQVVRILGQAVAGDYNDDGRSDMAVYLPSLGVFAYRPSGGGPDVLVPFGLSGPGQTIPAPGDYAGTGTTELAAYLPALGLYAIRPSTGGPDQLIPFGAPGLGQSIPAPGDYDGSGKTEIAVFIPSQQIFAYRPANGGPDVIVPFPVVDPTEAIPAPGDYDGTGKTLPAVYSEALGAFVIENADGTQQTIPFGLAGAGQSIPAPGDYDNSGKTEIAVYMPTLGILAYRPADGGPDVLISFGAPGLGQSIPAPGDYDASGKTEVAVYIPSQGVFAYRPADGGADVVSPFGAAGPGQTIPFNPIAAIQPTPTVTAASLDFVPDLTDQGTPQVTPTIILPQIARNRPAQPISPKFF